MKYTQRDMDLMALGEVGADIMSFLLPVGVWVYLGDISWLLKIPVFFVMQRVVSYLAHGFVHLGYEPEEQEEPQ